MMSNTIIDNILQALQAMSLLEMLAVLLALAYVVLAAREHILCWYAAFISTAIYIFLFWDVQLMMESALQVYYLLMAVYGWWQWRQAPASSDAASAEVPIVIWTWQRHAIAVGIILLLSLLSGQVLAEHTSAALPYLDSLTTWSAVFATYLVTQKVLENWLYWIVIDAISVYLYIDRALYLTVLLFVLYVVIAMFGYWHWRKCYHLQTA